MYHIYSIFLPLVDIYITSNVLLLQFCNDHSRASPLKHLSGCYNAVHLRVELRDLGLYTSTSSLDIIKMLDIIKVVPIY